MLLKAERRGGWFVSGGVLALFFSMPVAAGAVALADSQPAAVSPEGDEREQWGEYAERYLASLTISTQHLKALESALKLTPEQVNAIRSVHDAYQSSRAEAFRAMRDYLKKADEYRSRSADVPSDFWEEYTKVTAAFRAHTEALNTRFGDDVQLLLSAEQAAGWNRFARRLFREDRLRGSENTPGAVDLARLAEDEKLGAEVLKAVDPRLDLWEEALDRRLRTTDKLVQDFQKRSEAARGSGHDGAGAEFHEETPEQQSIRVAYYRQWREAWVDQAKITLSAWRDISAALPEDARESWDREFRARAFPEVGSASSVAVSVLKTVRDARGLRTEQSARLDALERDFKSALRPAERRWTDALIEWSTAAPKDDGEEWMPQPGEALNASRQAVERLVKSFVDEVKAVLTPEQSEATFGAAVVRPMPPVFGP
ncbi:MAG: hypothetical protein IBJ11_05065 [Phycisphaerales bacterium]|nr:hypothetical protein [Phycisphaerales bacterium]